MSYGAWAGEFVAVRILRSPPSPCTHAAPPLPRSMASRFCNSRRVQGGWNLTRWLPHFFTSLAFLFSHLLWPSSESLGRSLSNHGFCWMPLRLSWHVWRRPPWRAFRGSIGPGQAFESLLDYKTFCSQANFKLFFGCRGLSWGPLGLSWEVWCRPGLLFGVHRARPGL